jgi:trigger factor
LAKGEVAVVNYTGTSDGKPLTEIAPTAKGLTEQKNFWVETANEASFIPGFAAQLIGAQAGEKRTVNVDFPADFVTPQLQGKKGVYEVELVEVKEKVLPALNDELARKFGVDNVETFKTNVRKDLENELQYSRSRAVRNQVVQGLLAKVNFDLPETAVAAETRNVVYDIVRQNTQRGIGRELIEKQKEEIYAHAAGSAKERVKLAFLVGRIAEQEKITVTQEDVFRKAQQLAVMYQISLDQFLKDLKKREGVNELYEQVLHEKVLELLEKSAIISEGTPAK